MTIREWLFTAAISGTSLMLGAVADARPVSAQVRIEGRVIANETEEPVGGATVYLTTPRGRRLTQSISSADGRFSFEVRGHEAVRLEAARIGFKQATTPTLYFDGYNFYNVEIRLDVEAALLAPLEVRARTSSFFASGMLGGFEYRRKFAPGTFFTREDIETRRPGYVTDLLVTVPGVRLESSGAGSRRRVVMSRSGNSRNCPAQVYIDGFLMTRDQEFAIDEAVTPQVVHGIEVYRGLGTVPADFLTPAAACGVIAIWTRRSG